MTWNWLAFFIGIAASFLVSTGAMISWWWLTVGRHDKASIQQAQKDFDKIREAIRGRRLN